MSTRRKVAKDARSELVGFLLHRAFYPVLMAERTGPNKAMIERVQKATYAKIEHFRGLGSADEVVAHFRRDFGPHLTTGFDSDLMLLNLPSVGSLREDFERMARQLGVTV